MSGELTSGSSRGQDAVPVSWALLPRLELVEKSSAQGAEIGWASSTALE